MLCNTRLINSNRSRVWIRKRASDIVGYVRGYLVGVDFVFAKILCESTTIAICSECGDSDYVSISGDH